MAFDIGLITEFDDAVSIFDPDVLIAAKAVKLAYNQGIFWNLMKAPSKALEGMAFEIYGRGLTVLTGVIGDGVGGGWNIGDTTSLAMTANAVNILVVGSIMKVEDEIVVVKSVNRSAFTIDVWARGAGASAAAAHADTKAFTVEGSAGNDTDLKNVESRSELTNVYTNYAQTQFETVDYTLKEKILKRKGLTAGEIALLKEEAMTRYAKLLARNAIHGIKQVGSKTHPFLTAGLLEQLADDAGATRTILRYNAAGAVFSETILQAALENAFVVGQPDTILCNQSNKNIMNVFNQAFINVDKANKVAGYSVAQYEHEGKVLDVVVDQDMPVDRVGILTIAGCQRGWLTGDLLRYEEEPKLSSRENRDSLQGTYGFAIEGVGYDHLDIYGLV